MQSTWSIARVLAQTLLLAGLVGAPPAQSPVAHEVQDDLDSLRRRLMQPGEGARAEREGAIDQLLLRKDLPAHEVLARSLHDGDDQDGRGRFLLDNLARRLVLAADPVFGDDRVRATLIDVYVDAWLRAFADGEAGPGARSTPAFRTAVERCFRALSYRERAQQLERVGASTSPAVLRAALLLAGHSRDLGLAPWIAERLESRELGLAARQALSDLTFVAEPFADRAAFDAWQAIHRGKDYVQLAEEAARDTASAVLRVREERDALDIERSARLVAALARAEQPDWKQIGNELLRSAPQGLTVACAAALRDVLAERMSPSSKPAGNGTDRLELTRNIRTLLGLREGSSAEYALLLETMAYLAVRDDAQQRAETEERLLTALDARAPSEVRVAALRGLRRYPSYANRGAVIAAIEIAAAANDAATLAAGLDCLAFATWTAPDERDGDRARWVETIGRVLSMPRLDAKLAESALQVAAMRDSGGKLVGEIFPRLLEIAGDVQRESTLRSLVVKRLAAFATVDDRADRYVALALRLVADPDVALRRLAARLFAALPESSVKQRELWIAEFIRAADARLAIETDESVLRELGAVMVAAAEQPAHSEAVLSAFATAARSLAAGTAASAGDARTRILAEQLGVLGRGRARTRAEWTSAGLALLNLGARKDLRTVLDEQGAIKLADSKEPGVAAVMQLYIGAAHLEDGRSPWRDRLVEADELRRAFDALDRLGAAGSDPKDVELRLDVLEALASQKDIVEVVERGLTLPKLPLETQANWRARQAQAQIEQSAYDEAAAALRALDATGLGNGRALELWTLLAQRRFATGDPAAAARILNDVLARTPAEAAAWCPRFLLSIEVRLAADAGQRAALLTELRTHAERFREGQVAPELVNRYRELLARCST